MTLYLKYRSQTLEELDLESVRESLKKIVASKNLPHAFLFSGPKGTGKTSSARILAKIINCTGDAKEGKPCNKCEQCLSINKGSNIDVIELDAASHRGIDDIRSLRDAVKLAPAGASKKIYIIDEAHMLTVEASNALLKTLEEPPSHVIFILATTNPEKLLETIRSRTTLINFHKATKPEIVRSLERIVEGEKMKVSKEILELIAEKSDGSFRDAAKTMEQLIMENKMENVDMVKEYLFKSESFDSKKFLEILIEKDTKAALEKLSEVTEKGKTVQSVINEVLSLLRSEALASAGVGEPKFPKINMNDVVQLIELFTKANSELPSSPIEALPLEIAIIKWGSSKNRIFEVQSEPKSAPEKTEVKPKEKEKKVDLSSEKIEIGELTEEVWKKILIQIKPINASVEALLRSSKPISFDGSVLRLGVFYKFHKERLEETHHRKILEDVLIEVLGKEDVRVTCVLTEPPPKVVTEEKEGVLTESQDQDIINVAEKIFGS